jgi:2-aminoethylphosphonate-pyruvate transaminase
MTVKLVSMTPAVFHLPDAVNEVSRTYGAQPIVPRGPRLKPLLDGVRGGICDALGADAYEAVVLTGSGSTAIAAVIGSCLEPGERLMVIRNGAYGDRIKTFAERVGTPVVDLETPYGTRPDLERIEQACARDEVDALAIVYGCTSTCNLNPVREVGAIAKRHGKKLLVDGVSALFLEPMDLEALGVAAIMGCCNKGLHSHPNLTFALVHRDLMSAMEHIPPRAPSLELYQTWLKQRVGAHPFTIDPMSLLQAQAALDHLATEGGVDGRHHIYQERCKLLRAGYDRIGLRVARWEDMELSSIGTALHIPAGNSYERMAERLATEPLDGHAFEIYAAQGQLSDTLFRVFHMGHYEIDVYATFIRALEAVCGNVSP